MPSKTKFEIERKFLLSGMPGLTVKEHYIVKQGYLYADDNMEIRLVIRYDADSYKTMLPRVDRSKLTIKFGNGLRRAEAEIRLTDEQARELSRFIEGEPIIKDFTIFELPNNMMNVGLVFEASIVDPGTPNEFMYGEIEFESEYDAGNYVLPRAVKDVVLSEVTGLDTYQMKNHWRRTRKGEPV